MTSQLETLGPSCIPWTTSFRIRSEIIGQDFLIEVSYPPVALKPGQKVPAIFVLDGNHAFGLTALAARTIQSGPFPMPPAFVIGIGYHFDTPEERMRWSQLRVRDMSPWVDDFHEAQYRNAPPPYRWSGDLKQGGAEVFRAFIETEMKPALRERLPIDVDDETLVGASLGGLFTLYTLFAAPESFKRYVAVSPAMYWAERRLFEMEAALAARQRDLAVHLYLASGGLEEAHDERSKMVSNVYELDGRLRARNYPSLRHEMRIFDGENHMSVYPAAVTRGLGAVFGGYRDMHDWSRWLNQAASA